MMRNDCKKFKVNNEIWQYKWGKRFILLYSPIGKKYIVEIKNLYTKEEYEVRDKNTKEWQYYREDKSLTPKDIGLHPIFQKEDKLFLRRFIVNLRKEHVHN